ncbi:hypothetical protein HYT52_04140 [Candidatus Woesearchaeota archaeon]|nr:hypothetical protein [Candidatus Woesearchaeota archaeon]
MEGIDILALVFSSIVLVKMASLFFMPKWIALFSEKVLESSRMMLSGVSAIFIVIVGYIIFSELPIQTILAVMLFAHVLIGLFLLQYPKEVASLTKKIMQDRSKFWLSAVIYVALCLWGLVTILA